jgi:aryl-alcohol dehydrogenase-like predicted oxidoreductase
MTVPAQPELCLGTVQFGMAYGIAGRAEAMDDGEARSILEAAHAAGIRRLDTAPGYGNIEERLGALCNGLDFRIITKIPALPPESGETDAAAFVTASLERSRAHLGSSLCGILFHGPHDLEGPLGTAAWAAAAGWCADQDLPLGTSIYGPEQLATLSGQYDIAMAQLPGNALDQRLAAFPHRFEGIEITLRSIFLQGLLLMDRDAAVARLPAATPALDRWHDWCEEQGLDPLDAAVALAKGLPGVAFCTVGVDSVSHLEQIARAWAGAAPKAAPDLAVTAAEIIDPRAWSLAK